MDVGTPGPPYYVAVAEPPTLAMYLFKFGFRTYFLIHMSLHTPHTRFPVFPLFWLAGAIVLLTPLNPPSGWEPSKTEAERQELLELLRRTEVKWAKRCLVAFGLLAIVVAMITLTAVLAMRSQ